MIISSFPFPKIQAALLHNVAPDSAARSLVAALWQMEDFPLPTQALDDGLRLTAQLLERVVKESLVSSIQAALSKGENLGMAIAGVEWSWQLTHWHALLTLLHDQPELFDIDDPLTNAVMKHFAEHPDTLQELCSLLDGLCASPELSQGADRQVGGEWPPMVQPGSCRPLAEHVAWQLYLCQRAKGNDRRASQDQQMALLYEALGEVRDFRLTMPTKKGQLVQPALDNVIPLSADDRC